jgi:hypothetical protein
MIKFLKWIWRCFKNRIQESTTWLGVALVFFGFIHGSTIEFILGCLAIFIAESTWDKFFESRGKEILDHLDGKNNA